MRYGTCFYGIFISAIPNSNPFPFPTIILKTFEYIQGVNSSINSSILTDGSMSKWSSAKKEFSKRIFKYGQFEALWTHRRASASANESLTDVGLPKYYGFNIVK